MTRNQTILLAAGGSAALLIGAYTFQALGYLPCQMCLWQRWPHFAAVVIGAAGLFVAGRLMPALGALAALTTASIGAFHVGVEKKWWDGPSSCTGNGGLDGLSGTDLLATGGPKLIMCDQVSWEFLLISMPGWNALFSVALVAIWVSALRKS